MIDPRTSALDLIRCDLCATAVVQMHCDLCLVNLCKAFVEEHMKYDESKAHKVVKFQFRKFTPVYPGCESHSKQQCTIYCNQCDIPVCTKCLASDQHLGHKLSEILQIVDEKRNKIIKEQTELKEKIYTTYQDIASDVQNRMSQLEKEYGDLSTTITKHGENWHREITKLVKKLKSEVDEMKNTQYKILRKHLDEINDSLSEIKEVINSAEMALDTNDVSKLFAVKANLDRYRKLPQKVVPSNLKFLPGKIQGNELSNLFGTLSPSSLTSNKHGYSMKTTQKSSESGSSPPVKQLLDEPETVTTIDIEFYNLYNVACLNDEEIWTTGDDNTMKLFSINQGSRLKSITPKSALIPYDIAVTKSGDLVYTDYRTVNIVKNNKIKVVIRLKKWRPSGVGSTSSGDLLVIMNSADYNQTKVVRYSSSTKKQTIQYGDKRNPLYSSGEYSRFITENRNQNICVSDNGAKAVVVVDQAGKLRFRYTGHTPAPKNKSFSPTGITTDSQSQILTADFNNDCVHIIDQDGQFLRYIDYGLSDPWRLCTDTNDNLFVAQVEIRQVKKIKYLK